ncbi:hypothetical protein ABGB08_48690 [Acrocarpospora sp. B8E8]
MREQMRRERFDLLARLAFALEGRGVSCTLRLSGRFGEHAVLEMPGGVSGVVRVGMRKELRGWQYTVGTSRVWAQGPDPVGMILRAVSW